MREQQKTDHREIRQALLQLHDELERSHDLDQEEQALLHHLMLDIQALLQRGEHGTSPRYNPDQSLIGRMQYAIDEMQIKNPTLTLMIKKALDTLNIAGI